MPQECPVGLLEGFKWEQQQLLCSHTEIGTSAPHLIELTAQTATFSYFPQVVLGFGKLLTIKGAASVSMSSGVPFTLT